MKKIMNIFLLALCMVSLVGCGRQEIEATVQPFPEFAGVDFAGNKINNDIFQEYDATIINFWSNGCGSCIAEMPELETYYRQFQDQNINLMAVAVSAGDSEEERQRAEEILQGKGVTYCNIIPNIASSFYQDFIGDMGGFPITYIVDREGNMIGAPLMGVVKQQEEILLKRLELVKK